MCGSRSGGSDGSFLCLSSDYKQQTSDLQTDLACFLLKGTPAGLTVGCYRESDLLTSRPPENIKQLKQREEVGAAALAEEQKVVWIFKTIQQPRNSEVLQNKSWRHLQVYETSKQALKEMLLPEVSGLAPYVRSLDL